jgi:carboxypeptidase Taq
MTSYKKLKTLFKRIYHLQNIQGIMMWDEAVIMPEGAGHSRSQVMGTLNRITQEMLIKKKNRLLLDDAKTMQLSAWDEANLKWMEKKYIAASSIPLKLTEELTNTTMACEQAWRKLRAKNDWQTFSPYLERTLELSKEVGERKSQILNLSPYDALLDEYSPGFNQASIDRTFDGLKKLIPSLLTQVCEKQKTYAAKIPTGLFPIEKQKLIGLSVMQAMKFNFQNGRLDVSHHPFCGGDGADVRITTRYSDNEFLSSLMGICHETGHALYEQGLPRPWTFQPVGHVNSMAMHESQSLLIEMEVCRSPEFFQFILPLIKEQFGNQEAFTVENLCKLATHVEPGFIRVDADEVTYPMHIILRYEIEKELMNNDITIKDLPARWNELMLKYLNISTLGNDNDGLMQDVHWPSGAFGYFPSYTLGRMIAAQLFSQFLKTQPNFFTHVQSGDFSLLHSWLREHVYDYASSVSTDDLLIKVTGEPLNPLYFVERLEQRYF